MLGITLLTSCVTPRPVESHFPGEQPPPREERTPEPVAVRDTLARARPQVAPPAQVLPSEEGARARLTVEDLYLERKFSAEQFRKGRWAAQGPVLLYLESDATSSGGTRLLRLDLETDSVEVVVDSRRLVPPDVERALRIEDYAVSSDGRSLLLFTDAERLWRDRTRGFYYVLELGTGRLRPVAPRASGYQMFAKWSSDNRAVGFVRNRDLFIADPMTGSERRVTSTGREGEFINGTYDWVYEEEFKMRDGWRWSPDGSRIAFVQLDERAVPDFSMADLRGQYPSVQTFKYPKAGEANSEIRIGVYDVAKDSTRWFETNTWRSGGDRHEYLVGLGWTPPIGGRHLVWTLRLNREQNRLELLYLDPRTGAVQVMLQEAEPTWIEVRPGDWAELEAGKIRFLDDDRHFIWLSEREGYRHLYLYTNTGELVRNLTSGNWDVTGFHGLSDSMLVYSSTEHGALQRQVFSVPVAGGERRRVTEEEGWHEIQLSADGRYVLDTYSTDGVPPRTDLHRADGGHIRRLVDNQGLMDRLAGYELPAPEYLSLPGPQGVTMDAYLIKPSSFDSTRAYPLLIHVYGGPGSKEVAHRWGGEERLWHHYLAEELGIVVAGIDGRGTSGHGKEFKGAVYRRLGQLETADQIAAAQALAELRYVDESRIGIWGWSYGGYMTLMAMLTADGPDVFRLGMAVAPVTDWRQYDTIYTERYMSTPALNPDGYLRAAPATYAGALRDDQNLLLVHGDLDDNVHFQNTIHMVDALQRAGKDFSLMVYPGANHSINEGNQRYHVYRTLTEFLRRGFFGAGGN